MLKKLSFILIFSLLAVQTLSPLHMAQHGFDKHEHNGKLCDIYFHSKHQQYTDDVTPPVVAKLISYTSVSYLFVSYAAPALLIGKAALARAPPVLS